MDYLMTLQYDYCSVCLGHVLAWACPDKLCFICIRLKCTQIAEIFASLRKSGPRNTMVTYVRF